MAKFDALNANIYSVMTHIAKIASSPTMFGDRWMFTGIADSFSGRKSVNLRITNEGEPYTYIYIHWNQDNGSLDCSSHGGTRKVVEYFEARLNGLKRDDEGNFS